DARRQDALVARAEDLALVPGDTHAPAQRRTLGPQTRPAHHVEGTAVTGFRRRQSPRGPLFFFSSRRRHTRFSRDWSSDVCSSDLCAYHDLPRGSRCDDCLSTDDGYRGRIAFIRNVIRLEVEDPPWQTTVNIVQTYVDDTIAIRIVGIAGVQGIATDLAPGSVERQRRRDAPVEGEVAVVFRDPADLIALDRGIGIAADFRIGNSVNPVDAQIPGGLPGDAGLDTFPVGGTEVLEYAGRNGAHLIAGAQPVCGHIQTEAVADLEVGADLSLAKNHRIEVAGALSVLHEAIRQRETFGPACAQHDLVTDRGTDAELGTDIVHVVQRATGIVARLHTIELAATAEAVVAHPNRRHEQTMDIGLYFGEQ